MDQWGACHHFLLHLKHVFKEAAVLLARKIIYRFRIKNFPRRFFTIAVDDFSFFHHLLPNAN